LATRIITTPKAAALIKNLKERHGPLMFHLSGGCCDGSAPLCFKEGEFRLGSHDVLMGVVAEETPFYTGSAQAEYLAHVQLVLDVVESESDSFSLEASEGVRFISRTVYPSISSE
jgi:uncharacterized protein (DUF779 family)